MEPYILFSYTLLFVVSILPVFIVSLLIRTTTEIKNTKKITTICVFIQLISYIGLIGFMEYLLKDDTSGGMVGAVVIPALVAINALVGLISYPLVYMFILRREGWIRPFSILLGSYFFILSALLGKPSRSLLINSISRTDGYPCYLQIGNEEYDIKYNRRNYISVARDDQGLVVNIRHSNKDVSYKKMLWGENTAGSPVQFVCNFIAW